MKNFHVGIKAAIIHDEKLLLFKKGNGRDFWELPGGRIDGNETVEETLQRELKEEIPNIVSAEIVDIVDSYRLPRDIAPDLGLVLVAFLVKAEFVGEPQFSEEHSAVTWANEQEAINLVEESHKRAIENAFNRMRG